MKKQVHAEELKQYKYFTIMLDTLLSNTSKFSGSNADNVIKDMQYLERTDRYQEELSNIMLGVIGSDVEELNTRYKVKTLALGKVAVQKMMPAIEFTDTSYNLNLANRVLQAPSDTPLGEIRPGYGSKQVMKFTTRTAMMYSLLLLTGHITVQVIQEVADAKGSTN